MKAKIFSLLLLFVFASCAKEDEFEPIKYPTGTLYANGEEFEYSCERTDIGDNYFRFGLSSVDLSPDGFNFYFIFNNEIELNKNIIADATEQSIMFYKNYKLVGVKYTIAGAIYVDKYDKKNKTLTIRYKDFTMSDNLINRTTVVLNGTIVCPFEYK